jgi:FlaA1/EpsC-like NDP-sugar epimerase
MRNFILKWRNRFIAFTLDLILIPFAWFGALWLFYDLHMIPSYIIHMASMSLLPIMLNQAMAYWIFGLYRGVWRFASIPDLIRIAKAIAFGTANMLMVFFIFKAQLGLPRAVPLLYGLLLGIGLSLSRAVFRWLKDYRPLFRDSKRVLIVGGGYAGESLIRDLLRNGSHQYQPVVIVDDNPASLGRDIQGVRVVGTCTSIPAIVQKHKIDLIMIAIPSATSAQMRTLVDLCELTKLPFRTLPGINDLATGRVDIKSLRNVSVEDLLGRDQVILDWPTIGKDIKNKSVLVSGGGGSIGSELCRQIAALMPKQLIIIDSCEFNLYKIDSELQKKFSHLNFESILLDITDRSGLEQVFAAYSPNVVFHAAAYKHVPLLEKQVRVAIHNNVLGTNVLASVAVAFGVAKFVLISTDKAVNPTNLMGATKRAAELICQNLYDQSLTKFITVRFGNVLDSAGSVLPLFRQQIQDGGPLTVTHPDITRYFMSIPEACQLIIQAYMLGDGGEIYVLNMGEPIKISYLAEQMCKLAGKTVGHDIDIVYTGLRPGEKLYEELFYKSEELHQTKYDKIFLANALKADKIFLKNRLDHMETAYQTSDEKVLFELLSQLVPEYQHENKNLHVERIIDEEKI